MDDTTFNELKLRAEIIPKQASWPKAETVHWARLHEAADKVRALVQQARAAVNAINANVDLSLGRIKG